MLNFIIWNIKPQLLNLGVFEIRYYSLLFAVAFIIGYFIILRMLKREGLDTGILEKLTIYVVVSTIIGARLGHCLFYEFDYYIQHPLEMILPWKGTIGKDFRFTGYQGLASHGAAVGILIGIYLFSRKTKMSYLWTLDRLAIVVALAAVMIRTGNLMNSEIYGKVTDNQSGFVFVNDLNSLIARDNNVRKISYKKSDSDTITPVNAVSLKLSIEFSNKVKDELAVKKFAEMLLKKYLSRNFYELDVFHPDPSVMNYQISRPERSMVLTSQVFAYPRYPSQIYEAGAYLVIFLLLLWIYYRKGKGIKDGYYIGLFLILIFLARFFIEFIKEDQEAFESGMALNMGQWLSIPLVILGLVLVYLKRPVKSDG
ncbi:MAG: prolipoprotein diacylglyceryl transferase [Bacteroidales bacterium]|nr:prolipoprotein diacylglyceryl transferase [Bacteroidales bacterium]